jgi:hypothetical protein
LKTKYYLKNSPAWGFLPLLLTGLLASTLPASGYAQASNSDPPSNSNTTNARVVEDYGKLPMRFEANIGQTANQVKFMARGAGYTLYLLRGESVFVMSRPESKPTMLRMRLINSNVHAEGRGVDELTGKVSYFIGNDPTKWRANVPTYGRVRYTEVYPGIDVLYYGNQQQLEYDFVVAPGADWRKISLAFTGTKRVEVEKASGDLLLQTESGVLHQHHPRVYQELATGRREIESRYVAQKNGRVGFAVGDYDTKQPLVIDPVLVYSTYLGGSGSDVATGIAVDSSGNAYITGETSSTDFPTKNATQAQVNGQDVFVTKISADGQSLIYSTYLGGNDKNNPDLGRAIAVDSSGNAYVMGVTGSTDFPTKNALQPKFGGGSFDAFVTKLGADGQSLIFSTYLGGNGEESGFVGETGGIALDSSGNAYVTGVTSSTDFPIKNAVQSTLGGGGDVFVTELSSDGQSLIYSTYLGGRNPDFGQGIALDSNGNAYITGRTLSTDFPTKNPLQAQLKGGQNGFVTKLSADGRSLIYSTYLGGSNNDAGGGIAVDASGSVYISGFTASSDFPTKNALQPKFGGGSFDAFVTKISPDGQSLIYSTYLGGNSSDGSLVNGLAVDAFGNTYIASGTTSTDFPTKNALQSTLNGPGDIFVTKLSADGQSLIYSTYLGGSSPDGSVVTGLALDAAGAVYIASSSASTDFPTKNPLQANNHGGNDAVIVKIADSAASLLNISTRMEVLGGDRVLIAGFIVTGNDPKKVIIRGIGPSLNGVVSLSDPTLELHQGSTTLAANDNWKINDLTGQSQEADIRATTIPPSNDLESALVATLAPGNYTAILAGKNGGTGVGLVEVYDLAQTANSKLANISSRGFVDIGDNVMIGGFIVGGGAGGGNAKVIVRAIGPSLPVAGALGDPTLELHDGSGTTIASNDNWKTRPDGSSQQADIEATTIPPTNDLESAVVATLAPGNYTAVVRGKNNTTGVGLVEVYNLQ